MNTNNMLKTVKEVRELVVFWLKSHMPEYIDVLSLGLPEIDDRYDLWRVPLIHHNSSEKLVGEIRLNRNGEIHSCTDRTLLIKRINNSVQLCNDETKRENPNIFFPSPIPNKIIMGDAIKTLEEFPPDTAQLIITSPPYYNAKPEYCEYIDYQEYLDFLRKVIVRCHSVLSEGRFFIINVSPVLIRRTSRKESSRRIPIPFDVHRLMDGAGFEFIDDIIWVKPEGAGWATGRGRRFAADRNPLQYKPVPVTEYVLVYRKRTDRLIDWNIRKHYDRKVVTESKITGNYDVTNVWNISPGHHKDHPAVFPDELISKLIRYYSFKDDMVLDPFAGTGTVGRVALQMGRRYLLIENNPKYFKIIKREMTTLHDKLFSQIRLDILIND